MDDQSDTAVGALSIAHLANEPVDGSIWHRPQIPRPPHTESRSTPSWRAAVNTVVPVSTWPVKPEGVKTIRGIGLLAATATPALALVRRVGRRPVGSDPCSTVPVLPGQHVGGHHG